MKSCYCLLGTEFSIPGAFNHLLVLGIFCVHLAISIQKDMFSTKVYVRCGRTHRKPFKIRRLCGWCSVTALWSRGWFNSEATADISSEIEISAFFSFTYPENLAYSRSGRRHVWLGRIQGLSNSGSSSPVCKGDTYIAVCAFSESWVFLLWKLFSMFPCWWQLVCSTLCPPSIFIWTIEGIWR